MKINLINSPNFCAKHIDLRKANDLANHVNRSFPMFKPSLAMGNWKILNKTQDGQNDLRIDFFKKFQGRVFAMRDEYQTESLNNSFYINLMESVDERKMGNCYESAYLTLGALFANGIKKARKVSPRLRIVGYEKDSTKAVISKTFPIDHTLVLTSMNNPKRETIGASIVIDSWLNKAMTVPEAKQEYKSMVSKRELARSLFETQSELKHKMRIARKEDIDLNNYDFKYDICFYSDMDLTKGEIEEFSSEVKKKFPRLIMDYLA